MGVAERAEAEIKPMRTAGIPTVAPAASAPLRARAMEYLERGDVVSARLFLEQSIAIGDAEALLALAETYDPAGLRRHGVIGNLRGDVERARELYKRALAAGISEAQVRLRDLRN